MGEEPGTWVRGWPAAGWSQAAEEALFGVPLARHTGFLPLLREAVTAHTLHFCSHQKSTVDCGSRSCPPEGPQGTAGVKSLLDAWTRRDALRILSYHTSQNATEEKFCA